MFIAFLVIVAIILVVFYFKDEGFASPDGVVSRRSQRQVRDDSTFSKDWNLAEFEKSVALLNRKSVA